MCILFGATKTERSSCLKEIKSLGLPVADHTKFLGAYLDKNLIWNQQYNHITLKIKRNLNLLTQGNKFLSTHAKKPLYYGHTFSHLNYCIRTWDPMLQHSQIKKLQKLQNKCFMLIDTCRISISDKKKDNKLLSISEMLNLELAKISYKLLKGTMPPNIMKSIETDQNCIKLEKVHSYNTRQKNLQNLPRVKCTKYSNIFLCQSVKAIQPLLFITQNCNNIYQFIKEYKKQLFVASNNTS